MTDERRWMTFAQRLLAANQMGLSLYQKDGYRWISADWTNDALPQCLKMLPAKVQGTYEDALDRIDDTLTRNGHHSLLAIYRSVVAGTEEQVGAAVFGVQCGT